jgi:hypothetical protein
MQAEARRAQGDALANAEPVIVEIDATEAEATLVGIMPR